LQFDAIVPGQSVREFGRNTGESGRKSERNMGKSGRELEPPEPASSALDKTLSYPSSPVLLAAQPGGQKLEATVLFLPTPQFPSIPVLHPLSNIPPSANSNAFEKTLGAFELGLQQPTATTAEPKPFAAATRPVVQKFAGVPADSTRGPAEPPTRTLDQWAQCYAPREDGKGLVLAGSSGAGVHRRGENSPHAPKQQASGEEKDETYESDFEQYSSHLDDDDETSELDPEPLDSGGGGGGRGGAGSNLRDEPLRVGAPTPRSGVQARSRAGGGEEEEEVSELEEELRELQLRTAKTSAEQRSLEQYEQTAKVYRTVLGKES